MCLTVNGDGRMKYVEAYITKQAKPAGNRSNYYTYDKQTKQFRDMKEFKQWLKEEYGNSKRQTMYRDDKNENAVKVGYVIGFKTKEYEDGKYRTYYESHWIEVVEVETHNPFIK